MTSDGFLSFLFTLILGVQSEDLHTAPPGVPGSVGGTSGGSKMDAGNMGEMEVSTDVTSLTVWPHRMQVSKVSRGSSFFTGEQNFCGFFPRIALMCLSVC